MIELPLFPLNTVLFPGMPLQLHIFEPRYKKMIQYCQDNNSSFGVVLIKKGLEASGPLAEPHEFGCLADISKLEPLSEGRYNLLAIGLERFRILALSYDQPFLVGTIDTQPLSAGHGDDIGSSSIRLKYWLQKYIRILAQDREIGETIRSIPEDPAILAYLAAEILQIPPAHKQLFIEIGDCYDLIKELIEVYRHEVALLNHILNALPGSDQTSFSVN